jgi:hypothetical protein
MASTERGTRRRSTAGVPEGHVEERTEESAAEEAGFAGRRAKRVAFRIRHLPPGFAAVATAIEDSP